MDVYGNVDFQAKNTPDKKTIQLLEEWWELIQEKQRK